MPPAPLPVSEIRMLLNCEEDANDRASNTEWRELISLVQSYLLYMGFFDLSHFEGHEARVYGHVSAICATTLEEWEDPTDDASANSRLDNSELYRIYCLVNYCLKLLLPKKSDIGAAYM